MSMLVQTSGGLEELQDFTDNSPMVAKQVNKAPALWKLVGLAAIPASAALGFGIVPSRRLAAHALGAAATTVVGLVGKSKITDVVESAATPAIAQRNRDRTFRVRLANNMFVESSHNGFGCQSVFHYCLDGKLLVPFKSLPRYAALSNVSTVSWSLV